MTPRPLSARGLASGLLVASLLLVAGVFAGLTLEGLHESSNASRAPAAGGEPGRARPLVTLRNGASLAWSSDGDVVVSTESHRPAEAPPERPPWEVTPESIGEIPDGHVPAWVVQPPPPDPNAPAPPVPREPPDPLTHTPPMDNPGGVNGDRPERPVPGLP